MFVGWLRFQGAHVVQSVADFDENHSDVIAHGEQQLLEVFCLCRSLVSKDATTDFCESIHNLCHLGTEDVGDVFYRIVCIFYHIMEQCCADAGRTQSHFFTGNLCHGDRVHDIRFARQSAHALVRLTGEVEGFCHDIYLLAVSRAEVGVE